MRRSDSKNSRINVFPQAYLKRHGIERKAELNTIANRTLISNETNGKIKDKAPAEYIASAEIFPNGASEALLAPHFLDRWTRGSPARG